jgi:hypothetical protein
MSKDTYREKASSLVNRLSQFDLKAQGGFESAVEVVAKAFESLVAPGDQSLYQFVRMEDWWESTTYEDVLSVEDLQARERSLHLKRIALEAFIVARKTRPV